MSDNPITRKELYLAKLSGQDVEIPEPITREEKYLYAAIMSGGSGTGGATPDWNAADGEVGYVKNRTHYPLEPVTAVETIFEDWCSFSDGQCKTGRWFDLEAGKTYTVTWDGTAYECVCTALDADGTTAYFLGNLMVVGGEDSGEPFVIMLAEKMLVLMDLTGEVSYSKITITGEVTRTPTQPISFDYLPGYCVYDVERLLMGSGQGENIVEMKKALSKGLVLPSELGETILQADISASHFFATFAGNEELGSHYYDTKGTQKAVAQRGWKITRSGLEFMKSEGAGYKLLFDDTGRPYVEYFGSANDGVKVWHGGYLYSPSGKKFQLLVDDNGNLSTSEVTT